MSEEKRDDVVEEAIKEAGSRLPDSRDKLDFNSREDFDMDMIISAIEIGKKRKDEKDQK